MEKLLIFIKHNFRFLWKIIDFANGLVFIFLYGKKLKKILHDEIEKANADNDEFIYRELNENDVMALVDFFDRQPVESFKYFKPHGFSKVDIERIMKNPSFIMMGIFSEKELAGYFFLRFFFNGKCFIGRIVDINHRRKGIAALMNNVMYNTVWRLNFQCLSTISKNNGSIVEFHKQNPNVRILKELSNDYLLIEVVQEK